MIAVASADECWQFRHAPLLKKFVDRAIGPPRERIETCRGSAQDLEIAKGARRFVLDPYFAQLAVLGKQRRRLERR